MKLEAFITNLGKYNEGELVGEWIELPISDEELDKVYKRIGINEYYEETFMTDYNCDVDLRLNEFGEYESIERLNEIAEKIADVGDDLAAAIIEIYGVDDFLNNNPDEYNLYSDINNEYDLGYYWIEESGCYDTKALGRLSYYIDYEAFGRDVALESDGAFSSYGWIERC